MLDLDQLQIGDRVVLRYRLDSPTDDAAVSDALGEVHEVNAHQVTVNTRREPVVVERHTITHAKRVPPPPPRRPRSA